MWANAYFTKATTDYVTSRHHTLYTRILSIFDQDIILVKTNPERETIGRFILNEGRLELREPEHYFGNDAMSLILLYHQTQAENLCCGYIRPEFFFKFKDLIRQLTYRPDQKLRTGLELDITDLFNKYKTAS